MQNEPGNERTFASNMLPWILAVLALAIYVLTLNPWVSLLNLQNVVKLSGWNWTPELAGPAYYLITFPLRWLPIKWIPLALNLFSALCAALTVYQLARSVTLLPHDRTHEQRLREVSDLSTLSIPLAWLPPLLAVLACGLQITFWENATNGSSEMFDLLLFSYVVRSLLEYRIDGRDGRLYRAALVHGLGMTNNFAMIGFLPAFIAAIVWIRGVSFFHLGFLSRMVLCGLAGMSLYLLLPLVTTMSGTESPGFWLALKANLAGQAGQKSILYLFPKKTVVLLSLTSLLPVFVMSIRWASYFGDISQLGQKLATLMFHVVHAVFLFACLWMTFDPPLSPRRMGFGVPFLTFYYLGALSAGYFAGYFLLVFRASQTRARSSLPTIQINKAATTLVFALLIFVPLGLALKNLPQIRATNGPAIKDFGASVAEGLPKSGAVLSDDPLRLALIQSWLARTGRDKDYLLLDTRALPWPAYHRFLHKKYPQKWDQPPDNKEVGMFNDMSLINLLLKLSKTMDVYYLHPSFGYYFEVFYVQPRGLVYELRRYGPDALLPPPLSPDIVTQNESFWAKAADGPLKAVLPATTPRSPGEKLLFLDELFESLHVAREENRQALLLGRWYSRSLNYWGAEMQKLGQLEKAGEHFDLSQRLNPDNVVAGVNSECNKNLRAGKSTAVTFTKSLEDRFGKYRSWDQVLTENGPYDESMLCYAQAWVFMQNRLFRQAAVSFDRVRQFSPGDLPSRLALAQIYLMGNFADNVLALTEEIRGHPDLFNLNSTSRVDVLSLEVSAQYAKKEPAKARDMLESAVRDNPTNIYLLNIAFNIFNQRRDYTNALAAADRFSQLQPDNTSPLINKSYVYIQLEDFDAAIAVLNHALSIKSDDYRALLNRAIVYLRMKQLGKAREDYETLEKIYPGVFQIQFGLAEIAWQQKNTNAAIQHYETYLTNAPPSTTEAKLVVKRLKQLKGEKTD